MLSVLDARFRQYGRVIADIDVGEIVELMNSYDTPDYVVYVPEDKRLECTNTTRIMEQSIYGGCPVQTGYCNGHNNMFNALEYHRSSEVNIAATDMILLLGKREDVEELPKGTNLDVVNTHKTAEDKLLAASNKWLIAHKDAHIEGAFNGLKGENIRV